MSWLDERVRRNPRVAARRIGDETAIVSTERSTLHLLTNEVASRIWELADGTGTGREIRDCLCAEFEVSQEQAEMDLREFLAELEQKGLVELLP